MLRSLVIGDCVHNARTALDVFIWMNSTELREAERGRAAYPLLPTLTDEEEIAEPEPSDRLEDQSMKVRQTIGPRVAGLPEPLRSRVLDNMRSFDLPHEGEIVRHSRVPLLFELDNADKHRLSLDLRASADAIQWDLRAWSAAGEPLDLAFDWSEDIALTARVPEHAVVGTGLASAPIDRLTGTAKASSVYAFTYSTWLSTPTIGWRRFWTTSRASSMCSPVEPTSRPDMGATPDAG